MVKKEKGEAMHKLAPGTALWACPNSKPMQVQESPSRRVLSTTAPPNPSTLAFNPPGTLNIPLRPRRHALEEEGQERLHGWYMG